MKIKNGDDIVDEKKKCEAALCVKERKKSSLILSSSFGLKKS